MQRLNSKRTQRLSIAIALLVALVFRAMIPAGYMPAADGSFSLQVCHSGLPAPLDAQNAHSHSGGHSHLEYCPFGALPGAAPVSDLAALPASRLSTSPPPIDPAPQYQSARFERAHPPRAPPALA